MRIKPVNKSGENKTGKLTGLTITAINLILGFPPNVADDPDKVENSWGFEYKNKRFGIWDYNGSQNWKEFSTWGDADLLRDLFGRAYEEFRIGIGK